MRVLIVIALLAMRWSAEAAVIVTLGTAQDYAVLGGSTVTNTGPTILMGNVGVSPGTAITGFPPGVVLGGTIHANDAVAMQAHADAAIAYGQVAGEAFLPANNLSGQNLGTLTLAPGVYHFNTSADLTGTLRLDAGGDPNAAFHFQIGTTLITGSNAAIIWLNGVSPNIFWQVGTSATLGSATNFSGTILADQSITLTTGASLSGRALAINGAVTLDSNGVALPAAAVGLGSIWKGNASNLWSGANWSPDFLGATSDTLAPNADVVFSVTGVVPQNQNTLLDFNATISSLTVNDAVAVTISGPNTLSIVGVGANRGITVNNGAGLTTINSNLVLGGLSEVVTVNNADGLVINGIVGGTIGLTKDGLGRLTLTGANNYLGATTLLQGVLLAGAANVIPSASAVLVDNASTFDLAGNAQSVGSIADGPKGGGAITLGTARLITGNDNTSTLFAGIISGPGSVTKVGTGTWTLSGPNTFTGATEIQGGGLQAGAANVISKQSAVSVAAGGLFNLAGFNQSIGSLAGAGPVTLGAATLVTGNDNRSTVYSGVLSGPGAVQKVGTGTFELTGRNTYTGPTTVRAGVLAVDGSLAGDTLVAGGLLRGTGLIGGNVVNRAVVSPGSLAAPGRLSIGGNYSQSPAGALRIRLASTSVYDRLAIGGSAMLNGALNLSYLNGFTAQPGDVFTILTAGAGVSGRFSSFHDPQATGTLLTLGVVYEPNDALLKFIQGSFADLPFIEQLPPNELAVALALDQLALGHPGDPIVQKLNGLPLAQLPGALSLLSPEDLAAIFTTGLAISQVQVGNLERRLREVRQGATGFSDSGFAVSDSHGAQNFDGKSATGLEGKGSKTVNEPLAAEDDPRWGFFISGTGELGDVENTSSARGSSFRTGGVSVGGDYRVNRHLVVGAAIGYANTSADLSRGGNLDIDSGKGSLYGTLYDGDFYLNAIAGGGYGSFDTKRRTLGGFARGETDATDFNGLLGTGYDFHLGGLTVGPVASIQYSTVGIDGFTERGALGAMRIEAQSQDSLKSAVGLKAAYTKRMGRWVFTPEVRAQWQHEYLTSESGIDAGFSSDRAFTVHGPRVGRDGLLLDTGASIQLTSGVAIFGYYTTELGRENYQVHSVNGGVRISF
jgi:autotransporter-associated beta strand protein